jgi:hypothetical protein
MPPKLHTWVRLHYPLQLSKQEMCAPHQRSGLSAFGRGLAKVGTRRERLWPESPDFADEPHLWHPERAF